MSPKKILKVIVKCAERATDEKVECRSFYHGYRAINADTFIQALNEEIEKLGDNSDSPKSESTN